MATLTLRPGQESDCIVLCARRDGSAAACGHLVHVHRRANVNDLRISMMQQLRRYMMSDLVSRPRCESALSFGWVRFQSLFCIAHSAHAPPAHLTESLVISISIRGGRRRRESRKFSSILASHWERRKGGGRKSRSKSTYYVPPPTYNSTVESSISTHTRG